MRHASRIAALIAAALLVLGACGGDDDPVAGDGGDVDVTDDADTGADGDTGDTGDGGATTDEVAVQTGDTDLGTVLVDGEAMTLYIFTNDESGVSNCTGDCASNWPPLEVDEDFAVGDGLDAALFSTIERDDGSRQLAVDDMPLYRFTPDTAPGDTNGQGVGGVWFVVSPDGEVIEAGG